MNTDNDALSLTATRKRAREAKNAYLAALAADLTKRLPDAVWFGVDEGQERLTLTAEAAELLRGHLMAPRNEASS